MAAVTFNEALEVRARRLIHERINSVGQTLAAGNLQSYEQYKYNCGVIKGLQESLDLIEMALKDIQTASRGDQNG